YYLSGSNDKGRLDFTIKRDENILCVIEAKAQNIEHGLCQNFVQLQVAGEVNRERNDKDLERVYGVVTTGKKWFFTAVTTDDQISVKHEPLNIHLSDAN
ncbi:34956_t:CDS:2, partial [Gigaspora margarita]